RQLRHAGLERGHHQEGDDRHPPPAPRRGPQRAPSPPGPRRAPAGSPGGGDRAGTRAGPRRDVPRLSPGSAPGGRYRRRRRLERGQELGRSPTNPIKPEVSAGEAPPTAGELTRLEPVAKPDHQRSARAVPAHISREAASQNRAKAELSSGKVLAILIGRYMATE